MDMINGLTDDLLVKILLFLPTKVAVCASILSKRWEHLWMWLPKLDFDDGSYPKSKCQRLQCFLERNLPLPLHDKATIKSLRLKFQRYYKTEEVKLWIATAVSQHVRELDISVPYHADNQNILPSNLYSCESLVVLKLKGDILLDVPRMNVCDDGFVFDKLEHLKLCACQEFGILVSILKHCPSLQELDYFGIKDHCFDFVLCWKEPTMVPECLWNLWIFNWFGSSYLPFLNDLAAYILKNAYSLEKVTISSD